MKIGVIGGGSWGTTLANLLATKNYKVTLWVYEKEVCADINNIRENKTFLPGFKLSENLSASNALEDTITGKDMVLWVTPSHIARKVLTEAKPLLRPELLNVSATKGIEPETLKTNSQIIDEVLPEEIAKSTVYLSGPSFAKEVSASHPTAVTAASLNSDAASRVQEIFNTNFFRVYKGDDVMGLEIGGSLKNVIAIGAGLSDGLGFGYNARAALITRGLAEMTRLGVAMGAKPLTFSGLSGLGDLVLTCTGDLSRNRTLGVRLGKGETMEEVISGMKMVAEGVKTAEGAFGLSKRYGIDMPITENVYKIIYEGKSPQEAVSDLMTRDLKNEINY